MNLTSFDVSVQSTAMQWVAQDTAVIMYLTVSGLATLFTHLCGECEVIVKGKQHILFIVIFFNVVLLMKLVYDFRNN